MINQLNFEHIKFFSRIRFFHRHQIHKVYFKISIQSKMHRQHFCLQLQDINLLNYAQLKLWYLQIT